MLAIRMQRTGRSGHAQFRVIVQDSHFHPTRGKVVAYVGNYDPHTKEINLNKEVIEKYLVNGAQPSDRVASLLKKEGVKLPDWVSVAAPKKRSIKNSDKLRKHRPAEPVKEEAPAGEEPAEEMPAVENAPADTEIAETPVKQPAEEVVAEPETVADEPAETPATTEDK